MSGQWNNGWSDFWCGGDVVLRRAKKDAGTAIRVWSGRYRHGGDDVGYRDGCPGSSSALIAQHRLHPRQREHARQRSGMRSQRRKGRIPKCAISESG